MRGTAVKVLPENLTIGEDIDLRGTAVETLPKGLVVGGDIEMDGTAIPLEQVKRIKKLSHGEYKEGCYLYADGFLTPVKKTKKIGPYTYYVGKIPNQHVISDGTHFAHCRHMREGIEDLQFKAAKQREQDQYRQMKTDSVVTTEEAITMYRVLTGACRAGAEQFVSGLHKVKTDYTVQELIDLTKGHYGAETFEAFFTSKTK